MHLRWNCLRQDVYIVKLNYSTRHQLCLTLSVGRFILKFENVHIVLFQWIIQIESYVLNVFLRWIKLINLCSASRVSLEGLQSNLAISNSVNSKFPLFRRKIECPWIYPSPLRFPGYFEAPLFQTFFHFPWDFEIAGFDCS